MVTPFTPTDWEQKEISYFFNSSVCLFLYYTLTWSILVEEVNISSPSLEPTRTPSWRNISVQKKRRNASWPLL